VKINRTMLRETAAVAALTATMAVPAIVGLTAATASALPISQLQSECQSANGGRWVVEYSGGGTTARYISGYSCYYRDIGGNGYIDFYDRKGNYKGTG